MIKSYLGLFPDIVTFVFFFFFFSLCKTKMIIKPNYISDRSVSADIIVRVLQVYFVKYSFIEFVYVACSVDSCFLNEVSRPTPDPTLVITRVSC